MEPLTIGRLAEEADVNVETIRYYERRALIAQPEKPRDGYRRYAPEVVARIRFIKNAQELGFSLKEVTELLELRIDRETACEDVREQAEAKISDITSKIAALQNMKSVLRQLVESCNARAPTDECPILHALETGEANGNETKD